MIFLLPCSTSPRHLPLLVIFLSSLSSSPCLPLHIIFLSSLSSFPSHYLPFLLIIFFLLSPFPPFPLQMGSSWSRRKITESSWRSSFLTSSPFPRISPAGKSNVKTNFLRSRMAKVSRCWRFSCEHLLLVQGAVVVPSTSYISCLGKWDFKESCRGKWVNDPIFFQLDQLLLPCKSHYLLKWMSFGP